MIKKDREVLEQARDAMYCAFGLLADAKVPSELADDLIETERALREALAAILARLSTPPAVVVSLATVRTRSQRIRDDER
jgi:hypothetical protein